MAAGCRFYTYRIGAYYIKNTSTVAGFMMKACVIYLWKGKSAGMKNIHGAKPASVTGSCHSRWRPDAAFIHKELEQQYQNTSTMAGFVMEACVICRWKGKSAGMKKIHDAKPASVTDSCYSRWRPDAAFIHIELEHTISKYFYCGRFRDGSICNMSLER